MPFLVSYPKEIPAGSVNEDILLNVDFPATFCDWAGIDIPDDWQGRSIRSNLRSDTRRLA